MLLEPCEHDICRVRHAKKPSLECCNRKDSNDYPFQANSLHCLWRRWLCCTFGAFRCRGCCWACTSALSQRIRVYLHEPTIVSSIHFSTSHCFQSCPTSFSLHHLSPEFSNFHFWVVDVFVRIQTCHSLPHISDIGDIQQFFLQQKDRKRVAPCSQDHFFEWFRPSWEVMHRSKMNIAILLKRYSVFVSQKQGTSKEICWAASVTPCHFSVNQAEGVGIISKKKWVTLESFQPLFGILKTKMKKKTLKLSARDNPPGN